MSAGRRRAIARLSIAVQVVIILLVVILAAVNRYPGGACVSTCATSALGIAGALLYLRSTRSRS